MGRLNLNVTLEKLKKIGRTPKTKIVVNSKNRFTVNDKKRNGGLTFYAVPVYEVYEFTIGSGKKPNFLITEPYSNILVGENNLCIRMSTDSEIEAFLNEWAKDNKARFLQIAKLNGIEGTEMEYDKEDKSPLPPHVPTIIKDYILQHRVEPIFFTPTTEYAFEDIKQFSGAELRELLMLYVSGGCEEYDRTLAELFATGVFIGDYSVITPQEYQKFNTHKMIFTNPSTGKTTMATRVGVDVENATRYFISGGGTVDESYTGAINYETRDVFLEEIQDMKGESIYASMNNLEEQGTGTIGRGRGANYSTLASINYMGNVKNETKNELLVAEELLNKFNSLLTIMTNNTEAFGRRKALTVFSTKMVRARNSTLKNRELEILGSFYRTLQQTVKRNYSTLYQTDEINAFLETQFEKEYVDYIEELAKTCPLPAVGTYIKGVADCYRHLNGLALKLALLDHFDYLLNPIKENQTFVHDVQKSEEKLREQVNDVNAVFSMRESLKNDQKGYFENMIAVVRNEEIRGRYLKNSFNNLPQHLKIIIYSALLLDNQKKEEMLYLSEEIESKYGIAQKDLEMIQEDGSVLFSRNDITNRTLNNLNKTSKQLSVFGFKIVSIDDKSYKLYLENIPEMKRIFLKNSNEIREPTIEKIAFTPFTCSREIRASEPTIEELKNQESPLVNNVDKISTINEAEVRTEIIEKIKKDKSLSYSGMAQLGTEKRVVLNKMIEDGSLIWNSDSRGTSFLILNRIPEESPKSVEPFSEASLQKSPVFSSTDGTGSEVKLEEIKTQETLKFEEEKPKELPVGMQQVVDIVQPLVEATFPSKEVAVPESTQSIVVSTQEVPKGLEMGWDLLISKTGLDYDAYSDVLKKDQSGAFASALVREISNGNIINEYSNHRFVWRKI